MRPLALAALAIASILAGCGRDYALRCEDSTRYSNAAEIPPVRVPDDLSVPDETQALRIPRAPQAPDASQSGGPCLESPPDYYGGAAPESDGPGAPGASGAAQPTPAPR